MAIKPDSCNCQTPATPHRDAKRVVTLVHGTFARHADWIQDGQVLPKALAEGVRGTVLDRFCWSGKNRHTSRLKAGEDLRKHLVELVSAFKRAGATADHHVIAHSHGGNAALYALRERGDDDDALLADVKLITLATPFLFMRERPLPRWLFFVLPLYLLIFALVMSSDGPGVVNILVIAWAGLGILAFPLSLLIYRTGRSSPAPGFMDLVKGKATLDEEKVITVPEIDPDRLYVIRGLGDEAAGSLGAAQLGNWVMTRLVNAFSNWVPLLFWTFIGGIVLSILVTWITEWIGGGVNPDELLNTVLGYGYSGLIIGPLVALPLIAGFVALSNLPFGADSLFWNYHAQTTAEASPLGASRVLVVGTRQFRYDKLSHGVYEDREAIKAIVTQLKSGSDTGADTG